MPPVNPNNPFGLQTVVSDNRERITPRNLATSGVMPGNTVIAIGDSNIKIDGGNRRITLSDGVNNRILIGYQPGGF